MSFNITSKYAKHYGFNNERWDHGKCWMNTTEAGDHCNQKQIKINFFIKKKEKSAAGKLLPE